MVRLVLVLALAGVTAVEAAPVERDPRTAPANKKSANKKSANKKSAKKTAKQASTKSSRKKAAKKSANKTAKKSAKRSSARKATKTADAKKSSKRGKRKARYVPRKPTRRTLAGNEGMPRGFTWPPSRAMLAAEKECEEKLDRAGVTWERADPEGRIASPIFVRSMTFGGIKYTNQWGSKGPHKLDCQLALALETIGPELHAVGVREVRFGSLFRWSHVRSHGKTRPVLSRHGLGLAMDIGAFVDEAGRVASIKADYPREDPLLLAVEQVINASGNFRTVLTPRNDPISHDDHFHIEARSDFTSHEEP